MILKRFKFKPPTIGQYITWGIGLILAIALFVFMRNFIACWRLTSLAGTPPPFCAPAGQTAPDGTQAVNELGTPVAPALTPAVGGSPVELPPPWDGASRVTLLFIGLDARDLEGEGPPRSDTMMVLTLDPLSRTAGMLSIPRDLWVNIPGFGYGRINMAYALGESYNLPGGGPGLAMRTVENLLGVPVQYYAQIDFATFERMIGMLGGVDIYVESEITIDPLGGTEDTVTLEPGWHHLDGSLTLAYARARHTEGGDVDRARRQQQVIMAIRDKVMDPSEFAGWILAAPDMYNILSDGIHTNLPLEDALRLAVLAQQIPPDNIRRGVIGYDALILTSVELGGEQASVFQPIPDDIRVLRDEIFGSGALSPMAAGTGDMTQLMQAEAARVIFVNGSYTPGLAGDTGNYFAAQGMNVVATGNPYDYQENYGPLFPNRTVLIVHAGKPYTIQYLMNTMGLTPNQLIIDYNPNAASDLMVALGFDWSLPR